MNDGEGKFGFCIQSLRMQFIFTYFFSVIDFAPELVFSPTEGIYEATKSSAYFP